MTPNVDLTTAIANTQNEVDLLKLWEEERGYKPFVQDGILVESVWREQRTKIAFLLKESNDDFIKIRGKGHCPALGNSGLFWRNLNIWSDAVDKYCHGEPLDLDDAKKRKEKEVNHIAYVNLKKKAENKSTSNDEDIRDYVDKDWEFIDKQLSLIAPDVIFCGGTFKYVSEHLGQGAKLGDRVYQTHGSMVIEFYHPSYWVGGYRSKFEQLKEMITSLPASAYETTGYKRPVAHK